MRRTSLWVIAAAFATHTACAQPSASLGSTAADLGDLAALLQDALRGSQATVGLAELRRRPVAEFASDLARDLSLGAAMASGEAVFGANKLILDPNLLRAAASRWETAGRRYSTMDDYLSASGFTAADLTLASLRAEVATMSAWIRLPNSERKPALGIRMLGTQDVIDIYNFCKLALASIRCLQNQAVKAELFANPDTWDTISANPTKTDLALGLVAMIKGDNPVAQNKLKVARAMVANSAGIAASLREQAASD